MKGQNLIAPKFLPGNSEEDSPPLQKLFLNYVAHFFFFLYPGVFTECCHVPGTGLGTELVPYSTLAEEHKLRGQGKAEPLNACCAVRRSQTGS